MTRPNPTQPVPAFPDRLMIQALPGSESVLYVRSNALQDLGGGGPARKALESIVAQPHEPPVVDDWRRQFELVRNIALAALSQLEDGSKGRVVVELSREEAHAARQNLWHYGDDADSALAGAYGSLAAALIRHPDYDEVAQNRAAEDGP